MLCMETLRPRQQSKEVVEACMAKYGPMDVLVNHAGRSEPGGPAEISEEVWDQHIRY